jgi:hypothetical protein
MQLFGSSCLAAGGGTGEHAATTARATAAKSLSMVEMVTARAAAEATARLRLSHQRPLVSGVAAQRWLVPPGERSTRWRGSTSAASNRVLFWLRGRRWFAGL